MSKQAYSPKYQGTTAKVRDRLAMMISMVEGSLAAMLLLYIADGAD